MFSTKSIDKTQAFDGLAKNYDKARPSYPKELFFSIFSFWRSEKIVSEKPPTIADVGCGTGISTRAFYDSVDGRCKIIGIEPGKDMLKTAVESSPKEISYMEGGAEKIPLENESVDIVTAAQAAQWFNRPLFYKEVNRVLKPNGVVAIYENNRDWERSDFLAKHEEFLEANSIDKKTGKKYSRYYRDFPYQSELSEHFMETRTLTFSWSRKIKPEHFLTMAKTSTQVKKAVENIGESETDKAILENANKHVEEDGNVNIPYSTKLYMAKFAKPRSKL